RYVRSIPAQRTADLVFGDARFEEVLLLAQVHDLAHPRERVADTLELFRQAELGQATVGDELQVFLHHGRVHAEYTTRHGVARILDFQLGTFEDHLRGLVAHFRIPQVRVLDLDLVDHVDAEVHVHGFITQDVLELLGNAGHLVATTHGQDLGEAAVEEDALKYAVKGDQVLQQRLVLFHRAGGEGRVGQLARVLDAPLCFFRHHRHFAVHVEDVTFIHGQRLDAVLVGVGVDRFLEGLAQDVLAALRVGDQAIGGQHQVVGDQRIGGGEEAEGALDDATLVIGQAFRVLPQRDVGAHVDFLRHPVVGAAVEVFLPGPVVLEWHQLVEVGAAVDHALFVDLYATGGAFQFGHSLGGVHAIDGGTRAGHGVIRRRCVAGSGYFSLGGLPDGGCSIIRFCSRWRRCNRFLFFDRTRSLLRRRCDCSVVPDNRFFFRMEFIPVQHDVLLVFIAGVMAAARLTNSMCRYPAASARAGVAGTRGTACLASHA